MDKRTLKSIIIELREIDDKSFQEISDILMQKYNTKMSRQAVYGMYTRATNNDSINHNRDIIISTTDVIKYYMIGKDTNTIKNILANNNIKLTISDINNIIRDNNNYINDIRCDQIKITKASIINGDDLDTLVYQLSYKNEKPTKKAINNLIKVATIALINDRASDILARVYSVSEDRELIKDIIAGFELNTSYREVSKFLN